MNEAGAEYREALRIDPSYAAAHNNLGSVYLADGRLDAAIREFSEVARLQPESAVGWKNLAAAYAMAGQFGRAVEAADTALRLKPDEPLASEIRGQREKYLARTRQP